MIEVKLHFHNQAEMFAFFGMRAVTVPAGQVGTEVAATVADALSGQTEGAEEASTSTAAAEKPKRGRTAKKPETTGEASPAAGAVSSDQGVGENASSGENTNAGQSEKAYTVDDVRKALQELVAATDFAAGTAFVQTFGASRITEVKAEDYGRFVALAQAKASAAAAKKVAA